MVHNNWVLKNLNICLIIIQNLLGKLLGQRNSLGKVFSVMEMQIPWDLEEILISHWKVISPIL